MRKIRVSKSPFVESSMKRERTERTVKYDHRWRRFSQNYRVQNPFCVSCLERGAYNSEQTQVDHVIPLEKAPHLKYEEENLQTLCRACHSKKTAGEKLNKGK